jgi:hypothetical protein
MTDFPYHDSRGARLGVSFTAGMRLSKPRQFVLATTARSGAHCGDHRSDLFGRAR